MEVLLWIRPLKTLTSVLEPAGVSFLQPLFPPTTPPLKQRTRPTHTSTFIIQESGVQETKELPPDTLY